MTLPTLLHIKAVMAKRNSSVLATRCQQLTGNSIHDSSTKRSKRPEQDNRKFPTVEAMTASTVA